jgi:SAM-dependent methyltransferase
MNIKTALRLLCYEKWLTYRCEIGPAKIIKAIQCGGEYFRNLEYPLVYERLSLRKGMSVLDVGCGRSLFPLFMYWNDLHVTALEINEDYLSYLRSLRNVASWGKMASSGSLELVHSDSRNIPFPDGHFDRACNIGSIEHIRDDGDIVTIREMARVLKPGGIVVISVPFSFSYLEQESSDYCPYFERRYDVNALYERLICPSKLTLIRTDYFGQRGNIDFLSFWHRRSPAFRKVFDVFTPFFSLMFLKMVKEKDVMNAGGACIALQKNDR